MSKANKTPRFGGAILCNAVTPGNQEKVDCRGVFTTFFAWALPTSIRTWSVVVTLFDLPTGKSTVTASIAYGAQGRGSKRNLTSIDIHQKGKSIGNTVPMTLVHEFSRVGDYVVSLNLVGTTKVLKIPLRVIKKPWPRLSDPATPRPARAIGTGPAS